MKKFERKLLQIKSMHKNSDVVVKDSKGVLLIVLNSRGK